MEMIVPVAALKEGDVILQSLHNLHVVDVQTARFDQIKVQANLGDPKSMPGTHFYNIGERVRILRTYKRPDGSPMPENNTYDRIVGEEWEEGAHRMRLVLRTDGWAVWAVQESIGLTSQYLEHLKQREKEAKKIINQRIFYCTIF